MPDLSAVREQAWSIFLESKPTQHDRFVANLGTALESVGVQPIRHFSVFNEQHLERAMEVVAEYMRRAQSGASEEGLSRVLEYHRNLQDWENPDLLEYALMVFITHHPSGRALTHSIPPITLRHPERVVPSRYGAPPAEFALESIFTGGALPSDNLEWFREDPFANEHHSHWHVVYPTSGVPDPNDPGRNRFKDRQGELFFYMHQQMLARYDAERLGVALNKVAPLEDYRAAIPVGYDPGSFFRDQGFGSRPSGATMVGLPLNGATYSIADHETRRDRVTEAIQRGSFSSTDPETPVTVDLLGSSVEANGNGIASIADPGQPSLFSFYGNLHNVGHGMLAGATALGTGVMSNPATAIRDPVFFRWHRHIDDFYAAWQEQQGPQNFDDRPLVRLRKSFDPNTSTAASPDILLAFADQLPPEADDLSAWANQTFGEDHWDEDFADSDLTTNVLETWMLERPLALSDRQTTVPLSHLVHRPFIYFLRIENQVDRDYQVTVRIFLVPKSERDDRRAWIEMDKFVHPMGPMEKVVVARRGDQSSVIRKPGEMQPELLKQAAIEITQEGLEAMVAEGLSPDLAARLEPLRDQIFTNFNAFVDQVVNLVGASNWPTVAQFLVRHALLPSEQPERPRQDDTPDDIAAQEAFNYCTCGWPYNLLLPRGTPEGMECSLAVICTDWEIDQVSGNESCGSLSFCGAVDQYPDRREMGYPFNRPFSAAIHDALMSNANMAFRDLVIQRLPDESTVD